MLAIKNNLMAVNAARHLGSSYDALSRSVERLSSGLRINSAKDDAAGLAVRELMRADIAVIHQGARNALDGISMLQTMEGAMATIDDALVRMQQLAEQAATGSYSSAQRTIMENEFAEMRQEIAVMLFQREKLTLAQASRFARMHRVTFQHLLASRRIPVHYGVEDFEQDLQNLREIGKL